jgi:hypothetical protein
MKKITEGVFIPEPVDFELLIKKALLEKDVDKKDKILKQTLLLLDAMVIYKLTRQK